MKRAQIGVLGILDPTKDKERTINEECMRSIGTWSEYTNFIARSNGFMKRHSMTISIEFCSGKKENIAPQVGIKYRDIIVISTHQLKGERHV